jgi:hypothetical protein
MTLACGTDVFEDGRPTRELAEAEARYLSELVDYNNPDDVVYNV